MTGIKCQQWHCAETDDNDLKLHDEWVINLPHKNCAFWKEWRTCLQCCSLFWHNFSVLNIIVKLCVFANRGLSVVDFRDNVQHLSSWYLNSWLFFVTDLIWWRQRAWLTRVLTVSELQCVEVGDERSDRDVKRPDPVELREQHVRKLQHHQTHQRHLHTPTLKTHAYQNCRYDQKHAGRATTC